MKKKNDILIRVALVYFLFIIFAFAILARVMFLQFFEGEKWNTKAKRLSEITNAGIMILNIESNQSNTTSHILQKNRSLECSET